jgi:hypothetical protein
MMYLFGGSLYENLDEVIAENGIDIEKEFHDYLDEEYTVSQLLEIMSSDFNRKWYNYNLNEYVYDEIYYDFLNCVLAKDEQWLKDNDITTVDDDYEIDE